MERLRKTQEFSRVYRTGISKADRNLVMYLAKNQGTASKMGVSVSKKVGNSVIRHRIKRRLKEIVRLNEERVLPEGYDLVIIARKPAAAADYQSLSASVFKISEKLSCVKS